MFTRFVLILAAMLGGGSFCDLAAAADLGLPAPDFVAPTPSAVFLDPNRFEVRGGAFAHGDGSVEAVFSGPAAAVEEMIRRCHDGPPTARVDNVAVATEGEAVRRGFHQVPTV